MDIPETDSEDEIPPGWEERCTADGLVFYAYHETRSTQWTHPRTGKKKRVTGELPFGWERQIKEDGKVFFVDHINNKTTYIDPRMAFAVEDTESVKDLRQRFDAGSTGLQITHGRDLSDQVAIITGANSGIGFESARSLAFRGCTVVFACRNIDQAEKAIEVLKKERPYSNCRALHVDLASLKSVKDFAQKFVEDFKRCDVLILNAGVFGIPYSVTEDSLETNFQVNFLSHLYMALLLQPLLSLSSVARVVFVAAESHRFSTLSTSTNFTEILNPKRSDYIPIAAYNNSKLCSILGCFELHRRFADRGLRAYAVHPGNLVFTNLPRHWWVYKILFAAARPFTKSVQQACASTVFCAVSPDVTNCSGMYVNNCVPCLPSQDSMNSVVANKLWTSSLDFIEQRLGNKAFFLNE